MSLLSVVQEAALFTTPTFILKGRLPIFLRYVIKDLVEFSS